MKRIKFLSSICTISTLSSGVALYATSCSKSDSLSITQGDNCVWDNNKKTLTVTNVGSFANAIISLEQTNDASFKLEQTTSGIDIVAGTKASVKNILSIDASFTTGQTGKQITMKQIDGNASITITVIADNEGLLSINTQAMKGDSACINNQCSYIESTNAILANKNVVFGTEENPKYITVPLMLGSEMQVLNPESDLIALSGEEQIKGVSFVWTDPDNNDFKSITMRLNDEVYKNLNIWKLSNIIIKAADSFTKADITPLSINITKDYYTIESASPHDASGSWCKYSGIYLGPGQNDESPFYGLWNGLFNKRDHNYLKIAISTDILPKLGEITSWKGQIGMDDPIELEVVNSGSEPTKSGQPYLILPSEGLSANYIDFYIEQNIASGLPDRNVYISAEDNLGHAVAIEFKIAPISCTCDVTSEHRTSSVIQGAFDGRVWSWMYLLDYIKNPPEYTIGEDNIGEFRINAFNVSKPASWKVYAQVGQNRHELKLYSKSDYVYFNVYVIDVQFYFDDLEIETVSGNRVKLHTDTQFFIYGCDENNNVTSRLSFFIHYDDSQ